MTLAVSNTDGGVNRPADEFLARLEAAAADEFLALLRDATPEEAIAAARNLDLPKLYTLPREIVEAWEGGPLEDGTARNIRRERLLSWNEASAAERAVLHGGSTGAIWRISDIAKAANVKPNAVSRWRTNFNNGDPDWTKCLPEFDDSFGEVKKPGEDKHPGGVPLWTPSTVLKWLDATKRIGDDLYPHPRERGGRVPPGRPRKNTDEE